MVKMDLKVFSKCFFEVFFFKAAIPTRAEVGAAFKTAALSIGEEVSNNPFGVKSHQVPSKQHNVQERLTCGVQEGMAGGVQEGQNINTVVDALIKPLRTPSRGRFLQIILPPWTSPWPFSQTRVQTDKVPPAKSPRPPRVTSGPGLAD